MEKGGNRLQDWMNSQIGSRGQFSNETQWASRAGMPVSTFNAIRKRGSGDLKNLIKLARAAGRNPADVLEMAELLSMEEVEELKGFNRPGEVLDADGRELLSILEVVPAGAPRKVFLSQTRAIGESVRDLARRGLLEDQRPAPRHSTQ